MVIQAPNRAKIPEKKSIDKIKGEPVKAPLPLANTSSIEYTLIALRMSIESLRMAVIIRNRKEVNGIK